MELEAAKAKLAEFQAELNSVTQQLQEVTASSDKLKEELKDAQALLEQNNQNLDKLQQKVAKQIKGLKWQRNIAAIVAVLVLILK